MVEVVVDVVFVVSGSSEGGESGLESSDSLESVSDGMLTVAYSEVAFGAMFKVVG